MKKYTVDEMIEMDDCMDIGCDECPFQLKERDEKYNTQCKADIYCEENNIHFNFIDNHTSKIYIKHLRDKKLLLQDIMNL